MANTASHVRNIKGFNREELSLVFLLIPWLNERHSVSQGQAGFETAKQLMALLNELSVLVARTPAAFLSQHLQHTMTKNPAVLDAHKIRGLECEANAILGKYVGHRAIYVREDARLTGGQRRTGTQWVQPFIPGSGHIVWEFPYLQCIADAWDAGVLWRVAMCECGQYFFRRNSESRFCSKSCRERYWDNSDARKQRRRAAAREDYTNSRKNALRKAQAAIEEWEGLTRRPAMGWKQWVSEEAVLSLQFLTRGVNRGELTAPKEGK